MKCATTDCNNPRKRRHQHCKECQRIIDEANEIQPAEFERLKARLRLMGTMEREDRWGLYDRTGRKPHA